MAPARGNRGRSPDSRKPVTSNFSFALNVTLVPLIRPADETDITLILTLIRELAEFERLTDEVVAEEDQLRQALFGPRPAAEVLLAFSGTGVPAGFALFFQNFSTFLGRPGIYLEDLFVRPEFRRLGIGRALIGRVAELAVARGCGRFEWAVLDWNADAIGFYRQIGARVLEDWRICRVTGPALQQLGSGRVPA
jgi:GNAT superfamily N-acetyltransferase